jgi:hypothetical protein
VTRSARTRRARPDANGVRDVRSDFVLDPDAGWR